MRSSGLNFRPMNSSHPADSQMLSKRRPRVDRSDDDAVHLERRDHHRVEGAGVGGGAAVGLGGKGGGGVGFVECVHNPGGGMPIVTGLHGPELRHSVEAACQALLHVGPDLGVSAAQLRAKRFGVHLVNIAEPKEGPSAGLAVAIAMLSVATGRAVRRRVAITGELSVHGNVNAIGGVAEKLSAAARHGRKLVVIPAENASELGRLSGARKQARHSSRAFSEGGCRPCARRPRCRTAPSTAPCRPSTYRRMSASCAGSRCSREVVSK